MKLKHLIEKPMKEQEILFREKAGRYGLAVRVTRDSKK